VKSPKSWDDVSETLARMAKLKNQLDAEVADHNAKAAALQSEFDKKTKKTTDELKILNDEIETFALAHEEDFEDARTKKFSSGSVSIRKSTRLVIASTTKTLSLLEQAGRSDAIKVSHTIKKSVLNQIPDDRELARYGVKRVEDTSVLVKPGAEA